MSDTILRRREVERRTGYSHTQIWRLEQVGRFPQRLRLGPRSIGWLEAEIDEWIRARIRGGGSPVRKPLQLELPLDAPTTDAAGGRS
jgi:prophage regulatory protein